MSHLRQRAAYLELLQAVGPNVFDRVPDRFFIRELIAKECEIQEQIREQIREVLADEIMVADDV